MLHHFPMNHLAHCFLARTSPELVVGNMVADHVRGLIDALPYSEGIRAGIAMHRHIDTFTDTHPLVHAAASLLRPTQGKYAGIAVDVAFDYLLATTWHTYSPEMHLDTFSRWVCGVLSDHTAILPQPLAEGVPYMVRDNFLVQYASRVGMDRSFVSIVRRSSFPSALLSATDDILKHEAALRELFVPFFEALQIEVVGKY